MHRLREHGQLLRQGGEHGVQPSGDQPSAQFAVISSVVVVVLVLREHKEEQPYEDVREQRGMGSAKRAPHLLFVSFS